MQETLCRRNAETERTEKFRDNMESFKILWKVFVCSETFPDTLKMLWTLWEVSGYVGKQTLQIIFKRALRVLGGASSVLPLLPQTTTVIPTSH